MEIFNKVNWVDIVVLILLIRAVYVGVKNGLTSELFNFIGIILSLTVSLYWYGKIADVLIVNFYLPTWTAQFFCFVIVAQLIRVVFKYGIALFLKVLNIQFVPQLERAGGGIVGFGRGIMISALLLLSMILLPSAYLSDSIYEKSFSGIFLIRAAERTYNALTFWIPEEKLDKTIFIAPTETKLQEL